ncbi:MAG: SUMF1/EgtB/PvdO family nonheme iron enzyme [Alphaproteobacteria bacterium]|nr:SUMF1/EgtB/PvdO family nonheme iron enzyme [Alphaproteobacteria bacterium]
MWRLTSVLLLAACQVEPQGTPRLRIDALDPAVPVTDQPVTLAWHVEGDLDPASVQVDWTGPADASFAGNPLPANTGTSAARWTVTLSADDAGVLPTTLAFAFAVAPPPMQVSIRPQTPASEVDDLRCTVDGDILDALSYTATWFVDGEPAGVAALTTAFDGDTVSAHDTRDGQSWTCEVTATNAQGQSSTAASGPVVVGVPIHIPMVAFAPGTYMEGATPQEIAAGAATNYPRQVTLTRPFEIGAYEVTREEWTFVMGSDPSGNTDTCDSPRCPVENMVWLDAAVFADGLSRLFHLDPCYGCRTSPEGWVCDPGLDADVYACEGFRLPTAAEWEYAARDAGANMGSLPLGGDLLTTDWTEPVTCRNFTFSGAVPLQQQGVVCTDRPAAVGSFPPTASGLYDIIGNVAERIQDRYDIWSTHGPDTTPVTDPLARPSVAPSNAFRGGAYDEAGALRYCLGFDQSGHTSDTGPTIGLRIARTLPATPPQAIHPPPSVP